MKFIDVKTDNEIKILSEFASEIWHEYWPILLSSEQIDFMVEKFQSYNSLKNQIKNEQYIYNIISEDQNNVGYFGIAPKESYLFLSKLYIKKEFRGSGYGKLAFNQIKEIAKSLDKNYIRLTVNKYNLNTIKAYEKWGFYTIDSVVTDIGNGFVMDDYIMEFKL